jgi:hypothetical protein
MPIKSVTITINMGNDTMQDEHDVADALSRLLCRIDRVGLEQVTKVLDSNGNSVGTVDVVKEK